MSEEIKKIIQDIGGKADEWIKVSERPGKSPFAKELNYSFGDYFWGKVHVRNEGEIYVLVISKDVFNWKERIKDLQLKGEIIDAAGGLMWIQENNSEGLKSDFEFIKNFVESIRKQKQQKTS
ncbi:succinate dehydrogenase [Sulfolobus tengchongensis]|uniref:Succinate dehydrogenase n=1 Tax=Sulfolobus tengchongensis TaxID=207809 RepID=A0AAX4L331_9CREN